MPSVRSSEQTAKFYDDLIRGREHRGMFGVEQRYNPHLLRSKPLVQKYFVEPMRLLLHPDDQVLDFGCGPGTFLSLMAPFCSRAVGVDISGEFIQQSEDLIEHLQIKNARALKVGPETLPFSNDTFDLVLFMDVIHHLDDARKSLQEAIRVLKPNGRLVVFEPNKLNPLIWLLHWMDPNERGLLALGTPAKYRRLLSSCVRIDSMKFSGIVIGPNTRAFEMISALLNYSAVHPVLGWLNPKMMITARK